MNSVEIRQLTNVKYFYEKTRWQHECSMSQYLSRTCPDFTPEIWNHYDWFVIRENLTGSHKTGTFELPFTILDELYVWALIMNEIWNLLIKVIVPLQKTRNKGLVHPKIKISPCFTHPQGTLMYKTFSFRWIQSELYYTTYLSSFSFKLFKWHWAGVSVPQSKRSQIKRIHP